VSRKFCLLPQGFSEACAIDCEHRHKHLSLREIHQLEGNGDIELLDVHPLTKKARYVERDFRKYSKSTQIGKTVIPVAAGAYKNHHGEIKAAKNKIESHGKENREFLRIVATERELILTELKWNDEGLVGNCKSDGGGKDEEGALSGFESQTGNPVKVILPARTPECLDAALGYRPFMMPVEFLRGMAHKYFRERKEALARLDQCWTGICSEVVAGPFSGTLSESRGSELPSVLFYKIVHAYLS
jgi:hypothetical protein